MGKGELWDDSALVKAFDRAISSYKSTHGVSGEGNVDGDVAQADGDLDCGSRELLHSQTGPETSSNLEETANNSQFTESSPLGLGSSDKIVSPLDTHPSTSDPYANTAPHGNEHMISGVEAKGPKDYSSLLNKYYELEDQRQKVLQQLNQCGYGNYYHESDYQASVPQAYDSVACYCRYGCQNWVVPCNSSQVPISECACSCNAILGNGNFHNERDLVKTAMVAAERATSQEKKEGSGNADKRLIDGESKEATSDADRSIESSHAATDLSVVLNAWYSAGFYTAKYLSEQSAANRK